MDDIFWRWWSLFCPATFGLAFGLFYLWLPAATCRPHDAGCIASAWALWLVAAYAFAGFAVALRWIARHSHMSS